MEKRMTTQDIVEVDCKRHGVPFKTVYANLYNSIKNNSARVFRFGNTLFTSVIQQPKVTEIHLFTADNPFQVVKAIKEFMVAIKVAGFQKLITSSNNKSLLVLLQRANVNFTSTPTKNGYQIEIEV
jgi:hypothetical protein